MGNPRRTFLKTASAAFAGLFSGHLFAQRRETPLNYEFPDVEAKTLEPTMACGEPEATISQTEGPFYTPNTPNRANLLEPGIDGQRLVFEGRVLTTDCQPVAGAVVDIWSCDSEGVYHNDDFTLRGHVFTDEEGRFRMETIKPRYYGDERFVRSAHIHIKVQGRDTDLLTTQVYFPNDPKHKDDTIFDESLVMAVEEQDDGSLRGEYDFVLERKA